jgi:hypothetical protein
VYLHDSANLCPAVAEVELVDHMAVCRSGFTGISLS